MAHTPGPWIVAENEILFDSSSEDDETFPLVATVYTDNTDPEQWRADATLIAAARDMLAALKECLPLFDMVTALDDHGSNALGQAENLIRAAIAKAEG